jgi:pseudouridine synthase
MKRRADDDAVPDRNDGDGRRERIAKVIARAGLASRREAEGWISAGRVMVNGAVIRSPALDVTARDVIAVDGQALPARERTRLFLFHKPRGFLTTHADPQGRPTILALLPKRLPRLISVGRLDLNTEGLLLLTNDGGLARVLELPATGWLRRYRVRAHGRITQAELDRLRGGIAIDGIRYGPIEATADRAQGANVWLTFAMREGKNREIKNVLGHLGLAVNRLIRVSFGPFTLGDLAPGGIEEVRTRTLREQLGPRIAASTGADFSGPLRESSENKRGIPPPPEFGPARVRHSKVAQVGYIRLGLGEVGEQSEPGGGRPQRSRGFKAPPPDRPSLRSGAQPTLRAGVRSAKNGGPEAAYAPPGGGGTPSLLPGEGSALKPRRSKKKRGGGFGPVGEPERARQEKRRRRASRSKRR